MEEKTAHMLEAATARKAQIRSRIQMKKRLMMWEQMSAEERRATDFLKYVTGWVTIEPAVNAKNATTKLAA